MDINHDHSSTQNKMPKAAFSAWGSLHVHTEHDTGSCGAAHLQYNWSDQGIVFLEISSDVHFHDVLKVL